MEVYKSQTKNENMIMNIMTESLIMSYIDAAINNRSENNRHGNLFRYFYILIFIEMVLLIAAFWVEVLV